MPTEIVVHSVFKRLVQVIFFAILLAAALTGLKKFARRDDLSKQTSASGEIPVIATNNANFVSGQVLIVDADTLEVSNTRIRLDGIDAPEIGQSCGALDRQWSCGSDAKSALAAWIGTSQASCHIKGQDRYGRKLARCFVGDADVQSWLVINGWAMAFRLYSLDYVSQEELASTRKLGMWRDEFVEPWNWRKGSR